MDIGKYIGKFLLKHKYCSLSGLGVFDLKKIGSQVNASNSEVSAPSYLITFNPVGSIDDSFASFVANFENVSISNASNNIKEYCFMVKEEVARTGKFEIDSLGKLSMQGGKMIFQQSSNLDLGYEPVVVTQIEVKPSIQAVEGEAPKKEDYSYPPSRPYRTGNANWMKMLVPLLLVLGLVTLAFFAYKYFTQNQQDEPLQNTNEMAQVDTMSQAQTQNLDTTAISTDTLSNANQDSAATQVTNTDSANNNIAAAKLVNNGTLYSVAILTFDNEAMAIKKSDKLKSYGNNTSVVNRDGKFIVVNSAAHPFNDTTRLVDSLRKMFNPKGPVYILK